jgi:hypothetical protein
VCLDTRTVQNICDLNEKMRGDKENVLLAFFDAT